MLFVKNVCNFAAQMLYTSAMTDIVLSSKENHIKKLYSRKMKKRIFLSLALMLTTFVSMWAEDVSYIYYKLSLSPLSRIEKYEGTASNPTVLTSTLLEKSNEDNLDSGWYVLNSSFTYDERIVISGNVHLILCDGCTLTAKQGIRINTDATLSIYAQSEKVGTMGKLVAMETHHDKAAIGGNKDYEAGGLFIHGGEIEADADDGKYAAGIGGGYGDGSGMKAITIYSGKVTAKGARYGAGIGGGRNNNYPCTINIYGGDITADGGRGGAGIGGGMNRGNWPVNIYGGIVNATGHGLGILFDGSGAAGIGGGDDATQTGRICIYDGTVTAEGHNAAGIGGGYKGKGGEIFISGGTVTAIAGLFSAAIGGGWTSEGGYVRISGGTVTADSHGTGGAAIGGGDEANGGTIEITGGHVTTKADKSKDAAMKAYNIGSGQHKKDQTIILGSNMCVKPESGLVVASQRIEACWGKVEPYYPLKSQLWTVEVYACAHDTISYTIDDANKHMVHCKHCEYTRSEEHSVVAPSTTCEKCGYGEGATICTLAFPETSTAEVSGYATAGFQAVQGRAIAMPACTKVPEGWTFVGWLRQSDAPSSIEAADSEGTLWQPGSLYIVEGDEIFFARYRYDFTPTWTWSDDLTTASLTIQAAGGEPISVEQVTVSDRTETAATDAADGSITATATATYTHENTTYTFSDTQKKVLSYNLSLGEDDNTEALTTYNGRSMNVAFTGRTLYKDGSWNTLCLPFYVEDISGSPLAGATVKELTDASFADGTLTLTFADAASIKAGQAYLVKWDSGTDLGPSDLIFSGVTLANYLSDDEISVDDSGTATITFMGTYKKQTLAAGDRTVFYIGADNTLYYPQSAVSIGAQRAYFKLSGLTVDEFSAGINSLTLDFGDEETTGIINLTPSLSSMGEGSADWYTLDGRRLSGKATQKGIYINNGKKVVIK